MNTKHKSLRKFCLLFLCLGCSSTSMSNQTTYKSRALEAVSYKSDQAQIEKMRTSIPEEIRESNDTKSYLLGFFKDRTRDPNDIRSNFQKDLVKKRNQSQKILAKERQDFNNDEKKIRDEFFKQQKSERDDFMRSHSKDRDKIKDNYSEQSAKKKEFLANQKDRRDEFSAKQQVVRKDLAAYFKDLRGSFDEEWKLYKQEYKDSKDEKKREKILLEKAAKSNPKNLKNDLEKYSPEVQKLILELDEMHKKPGEDL